MSAFTEADVQLVAQILAGTRWKLARDDADAVLRALADAGRLRPIPVLGLQRLERCERRVDVDDLAALGHVFAVEPWSLTRPPTCAACRSAPPAGFTCNACGAAR